VELISVCISAFIGVFLLLTVLAIVMRIILVLFPAKEIDEDGAMLAAVATTITTMFPGTKITKIEEIK
jgi:hypothetical protein